MTSTRVAPIHLVLVGAGHAHLAVIASAARLRAAGVHPVLIAPATFDYSGLATGVLSGALSTGSARIDIATLTRKHDVPHTVAEVIGIDRPARILALENGSQAAYDVVSFNIGSTVEAPQDWIGRDGVWPVKPLSSLFALRAALEAHMAAGSTPPAIVVAGDGPTGFEIAAALTGLHQRHGCAVNLTLTGPKADARWAPGSAGHSMTRSLDRRGVKRVLAQVVAHEPGHVSLSDGQTLACDHLVLATGLRASILTQTLDLPLDDRGRIKVAPILCSIADNRVFAAGDCATIKGDPRPFAGVFGVRAADVLIDNLCALGTGTKPRPYRPQKHWLSIMDLGDDTGLAMRDGLWWQGRLALALKRRLDLGFVARSRT
ncbi:FAD-dependent oxidoreductase [Brevundimonas variabilis]|uniref:NADH dehydrogenase FAD-containing subunit n=1 Tax=Brevundimonas variabilis TaxID=74312 RepID=A0A7W9CKA4_9CAUL|nr:FAD-dependent oxidoreductase [Brevundimonas variabilis]MBB5746973.1 NADH dehydrogenase FAD-containing subunit [Brevundimonas variabilis]